MEPDKNI